MQKFGGTSLGSAKMITRMLDISSKELPRKLLVVASAMGKTTDTLQQIGQHSAEGGEEVSRSNLLKLKDEHYTALVDLLKVPLYEEGKKALDVLFGELESFIHGLILIRETSPRSWDALLSFGERLSTTLIYYGARQRGIATELLDSRNFIRTEYQHGRTLLLPEETEKAIHAHIRLKEGVLHIAQGFIGSDMEGVTTTLGRGGSDYSATILAAALNAEEVQIWTDVDGIMTSDPRLIRTARTIGDLSYAEAAELSYFGAKVIHPSAIQPAVEKKIPVLVKNSFSPASEGSRIHAEGGPRGIQAIASKDNITLVNIQSSRMLNAYGFLRRIFEVFEKHRISVDLIATSEVSVSLTVEDDSALTGARQDLEVFSAVTIEQEQAIISLVGQDLWVQSRFTAQVFSILADIPLRMISLGSSDINLSLVVPQHHLDHAIQSLHDSLFAPPTDTKTEPASTSTKVTPASTANPASGAKSASTAKPETEAANE